MRVNSIRNELFVVIVLNSDVNSALKWLVYVDSGLLAWKKCFQVWGFFKNNISVIPFSKNTSDYFLSSIKRVLHWTEHIGVC